MYIQYVTYCIFSREITIHTVIYGADIQFWPTLHIMHARERVHTELIQIRAHTNTHIQIRSHTNTQDVLRVLWEWSSASPSAMEAHAPGKNECGYVGVGVGVGVGAGAGVGVGVGVGAGAGAGAGAGVCIGGAGTYFSQARMNLGVGVGVGACAGVGVGV